MTTILIKNARAIITLDEKDTVLKNQNIFIKDNYFDYIGNHSFVADKVIDASGMFVYPGLINTHHHLYQTFTRNLPQVQNLELFDWLVTLYEIWRGINSQIIYYSAVVGMGELLKYGCTTCFDHHYVFPKENSSDFIDQQFLAAEKLGMRFHASRGSMSRGKSNGGLPPDELVQSVEVILADSLRLIEKYHDASKYSMRQIVLAPCSPFSVTSDLMVKTAELARQKNVRLHTHLAETKDEEEYCMEKFNMRPLEYMESLGWIGKDVWFAHGIHFNDQELRKLASTQTGVAHCPISNQKLSSGIAQIPTMLQLGVPVGLAVDGSASNDGSNLLAELRASFLLHRLQSSHQAPRGYDVLKMATKGGAKILGRHDIGSIEVGKAADLFMIDSNRLEYVGAQFDPKSLLATVGVNRPVAYTIVNGQIVVEDGELCNIDEKDVVNKANLLLNKLIAMV
jgi:cytosine/adenosine deaminase-related metal-dependent hydrolase